MLLACISRSQARAASSPHFSLKTARKAWEEAFSGARPILSGSGQSK